MSARTSFLMHRVPRVRDSTPREILIGSSGRADRNKKSLEPGEGPLLGFASSQFFVRGYFRILLVGCGTGRSGLMNESSYSTGRENVDSAVVAIAICHAFTLELRGLRRGTIILVIVLMMQVLSWFRCGALARGKPKFIGNHCTAELARRFGRRRSRAGGESLFRCGS